MADTTRDSQTAIPDQPQPQLGACTTAELDAYEAALRKLLEVSRDAADRMYVMRKLEEVKEQRKSRERITPGKTGSSWPLTN